MQILIVFVSQLFVWTGRNFDRWRFGFNWLVGLFLSLFLFLYWCCGMKTELKKLCIQFRVREIGERDDAQKCQLRNFVQLIQVCGVWNLNDLSKMTDCHSNDPKANTIANQNDETDLEKQRVAQPLASEPSTSDADDHTPLTIVVSNGEPKSISEVPGTPQEELLPCAVSPKKELLSTTSSSDEQCRICQQEKEEVLIELGCHCRGGLAKAHRTCIDTWFRTKGSNRCEICQVVAANVSPPQSHHGTNYWIWRIDPTYRTQDTERQHCFSPLWLAFAILIGGLLLDILISITLGVSALPVNIIIGVIVVLGLGTVFRLALEFFQEWNSTRGSQRVESNVTIGYFPAI